MLCICALTATHGKSETTHITGTPCQITPGSELWPPPSRGPGLKAIFWSTLHSAHYFWAMGIWLALNLGADPTTHTRSNSISALVAKSGPSENGDLGNSGNVNRASLLACLGTEALPSRKKSSGLERGSHHFWFPLPGGLIPAVTAAKGPHRAHFPGHKAGRMLKNAQGGRKAEHTVFQKIH
jgi:hypothetical protein